MAVPVAAGAGDAVELDVEAASNPDFIGYAPSQQGRWETAGTAPGYVLRRAELVVVDPEAEALLYDFDVLHGLLHTFADRDPRGPRLRRTLAAALDQVDVTG